MTIRSKIEGKEQAHNVSFQPTVDLPYTDVQRAVEGVDGGGGGGGSGAPTDAQYLVSASASGLTNERLVQNSSTITWDFTGLGTAVANWQHLGLEDLSDPGGDRGIFWDASAAAAKWFRAGTGLGFVGDFLSITDPNLTAIVDDQANFAGGDILYHDGATLKRLAAGSSGQVLRTLGAGSAPQWTTATGLGDMLTANNLSDVQDVSQSRLNLGLGTTDIPVFGGLEFEPGNGGRDAIFADNIQSGLQFGMYDGSTVFGAYFQVFGNNWGTVGQRGGAEFVFDSRNSGTGGFSVFEYAGSWTQRFRVSPGGNVSIPGLNNGNSLTLGSGGHAGNLHFGYSSSSFRFTISTDNSGTKILFNTSGGTPIGSSVGWGISANSTSDPDVIHVRDAADVLAQRRGTNPQASRLYNTFTDASNYERGFLRWNTNVFEIGTEAAGTGTTRGFALKFGTTNMLSWSGTDTMTLGAKVQVPGGNFLHNFTSGWQLSMGTGNSANSVIGGFTNSNFVITADKAFGWSTANAGSSQSGITPDTLLFKDAAGIIAQRNSTNAQTFRWYRTFTDASNYERGALQTGSGYIEIAAETAGTGAAEFDIRLTPKGSSEARVQINSAGSTANVGFLIKEAGTDRWEAASYNAGGTNRSFTFYNKQTNSDGLLIDGDRGYFLIQEGGTTPRLAWAGLTSSFPSLKRSGTELQARLADDSAYSNIRVATLIAETDVTVGGDSVLVDSDIGVDVQAYDGDLAALAALAGTGIAVRTGTDTWAQRTITGPAAGLTVSNGNGVSGNPTLALANDLAALEGLGSTGLAARTGSDTWAQRSIQGTANEVAVANGDGVAGNPTVSLPSSLTFTGKTITGGTFSSPTAITGLPNPTNAQDAATKAYVDSVAAGLDVKPSVKCATTANITLSGTQTIDGVSAGVGDRVLVKNQTTQAQNGIYVVAAGAWSRATDMDSWGEVPGSFVFVEQGTTYADTAWVCTADTGGTLGTTAITWNQFAGAGTYTAGTGLSLTGTQFAISDPELLALAGLTSASDRLPYFTGSGTASLATFTAFGRSLVDDANAAAARGTLGLATSTTDNAIVRFDGTSGQTQNSSFATLSDVGQFTLNYTGDDSPEGGFVFDVGSSTIDSRFAINIKLRNTGARKGFGISNAGDSFGWAAFEWFSGSPGFLLGPGSGARDVGFTRSGTNAVRILASAGATFTGTIDLGDTSDATIARSGAGDISVEGNIVYRAGGTDVPVTDGGTGASDASGARTNLGLAIGTDVQAFDPLLNSIAGLTFGADSFIYGTGSDTAAAGTITSFGRSLIDDADAAAARSTLGLVIGTNVQAFDADLSALAALAGTGIARRTGTNTWTVGTTISTSEIGDDQVTTAKLQNGAAWSLLGRNAATSGDPSYMALADLTEELGPTDGDYIVGFLSTGELRKFDIANLPGGSGGLNVTTLMGLVAGDAASESSGQLTLDVDNGNNLYFTATLSGSVEVQEPVDMPVGSTISLLIDPTQHPTTAPAIAARSQGGTSAVDTTSHSITLPSGISAGDLLIVVFSVDGAPTVSVNTGVSGSNWNKLGQDSNSTTVTGAIFWKVAEGSDALTLTTSSAEQSTHICFRITGVMPGLTDISGTSANGSSTNGNPPDHTPPNGTQNYLSIATLSTDAQVVATAAGASYVNLTTQTAAGANGASTSVADRTLSGASSENPSPFTNTSEQWVCWTILIGPSGIYNVTWDTVFEAPTPSLTEESLVQIQKLATSRYVAVKAWEAA